MAAFLLAAVSISRTLAGRGPFVAPGMLRYESMTYAIAYIALAAISSLLLAAFAMERRRADARQRLSLEATSVLVRPVPLGERLRQVTEMMVSAELARAAELRIGAAEFTSPPGHPPLQGSHESEVRVVPLEEENGALKLQAMPQLGYFDDVDVHPSSTGQSPEGLRSPCAPKAARRCSPSRTRASGFRWKTRPGSSTASIEHTTRVPGPTAGWGSA